MRSCPILTCCNALAKPVPLVYLIRVCFCVCRSIAWVCDCPLCMKSISVRSWPILKLLKVCTVSDSPASGWKPSAWPDSLWKGGGVLHLQAPPLGTNSIRLVIAEYYVLEFITVSKRCIHIFFFSDLQSRKEASGFVSHSSTISSAHSCWTFPGSFFTANTFTNQRQGWASCCTRSDAKLSPVWNPTHRCSLYTVISSPSTQPQQDSRALL